MLKHKQKKWRQIRLFIFGILIGSMVGVSVFWWLMYFNKSDWYFTKQMNNWIENLFTSSADLEDNDKIALVVKDKDKNNKNTVAKDSLIEEEYADEFYYENSEPLIFEDSLSEYDTNVSNENDNSAEVKKDELLLSKEIQLPNNTDLMLDSLMGINVKSKDFVVITVEFWKSPVNFRGYKRSPKKVVVYGVKNIENVDFKMKEGKLIMVENSRKFILRHTNAFLKLEPIN